MATRKKGPPKPPRPPGVRRGGGPRKRLPEDLEEFARSDEKRFRPRRKGRPPRLKDPRAAGVLVPGVANRDARRVYEARADALRRADGEEREELLAEAQLLQVWRGFAITGFDAFVEDALGFPLEEARAQAARGAERLGVPLAPLSDDRVALWMRAEVGLLDAGGRVTCRGEELRLHVPFAEALRGLDEVGRRIHPLVRDQPPPRKPATDPKGPRSRRKPSREPHAED